MPEAVFIDIWGWLALGHRRDARHQEIKACYQALQENGTPFYTTVYVLDETITLLFRREVFEEAICFMEGIFHSVGEGHLTVERVTSDCFSAAWQLRKQFQDKPKISFTDLTSMIFMAKWKIKKVLTEDDHFLQLGMGFQKIPEDS